jgi:hypothetical protein
MNTTDINLNLQFEIDKLKEDLRNSNQLTIYLEDIVEKQKDEIGKLYSKIKELNTEIQEIKKISSNESQSIYKYMKSFFG